MSDDTLTKVLTEFTLRCEENTTNDLDTVSGLSAVLEKAKEDLKQVQEAVPGFTITGSVSIGRKRYKL